MKTLENGKALLRKAASIALLLCITVQCENYSSASVRIPDGKKKSIKLAILLDTSNSMDGLIDQAKSQLWTIVNELGKATCNREKPDLKIALYEYGNDNLPQSEGFIRLVCPLTNDLDRISAALFALRTNGGQEYCGQVIQTALKEQDWNIANGDYQVVFIAGNEPFNQGSYDFRESCAQARKKGVVVNTIFCGDFDEGISTNWKDGALLTGGDYCSIEQNRKTVYIESPWDKRIVELNQRLNDTYVYYGKSGYEKKEMQAAQDVNAASMGSGNLVGRAVSKSSHVYENSSWDLVDATKNKQVAVAGIKVDDLPSEMKNMSVSERENYVKQKSEEREKIQQEISLLNQKREQYIRQQQISSTGQEMLDNAILNSIRKQGQNMGFAF
ncbi:MAG: VWA domain-containing protein [Bacteroidales bacterium]